MNWDEAEDDASQRFASSLVPRQSPTKQEEELLSAKIEAKRLLMKLNGALDELKDHMGYAEDRSDEEEYNSDSETKYISESNRNRANTGGRRLGGRNRNNEDNNNNKLEQKTRQRRQQREVHTPQRKQNEDKNIAGKRPEWNDRYQANDSPFDYEAPKYKKGFHPASPAKTLRSGMMRNNTNINNNVKKKTNKKYNNRKKEWDSRIIATRSALDDRPQGLRKKNSLKKRMVSLKDLEHLASLAPTASLKELLDIGKNAVNLQKDHHSRRAIGKSNNGKSNHEQIVLGDNEGKDAYFYDGEEFDEEDDQDLQNNEFNDDNEYFKEESLEDEEDYDDDFIDASNNSDNSTSLVSVGGSNINALLKKYANEKQNRSRQIRYTDKALNGRRNNYRKKLQKIPKRKISKVRKTKKKIAAIKASNRQRLKQLSNSKKKKSTKRLAASSLKLRKSHSHQQHIRWHQGDVLDNPGIPRSPGGILKYQRDSLKHSNSAPAIGSRRRKRPQSAPGFRTGKNETPRGFREKKSLTSVGKDDSGLLKWNWNGPRDAADTKVVFGSISPSSPSHWSNKINGLNFSRPLHLPKKRLHPQPKIPVTKFRPIPITGGGKTRSERIQNYRLEHFPEYARIGEGQMCVSIAHCSNCHTHKLTTRHDEGKYSSYAQQLAAGIRFAMPLVKVIVKPVGGRLIGGFEVQMCRQEAQKLTKTLLHSKLLTNTWPDIPLLIERIKTFTPKHELVVNVSANVEDDNILSTMVAKVIDEKGKIVCDPEYITILRSLERNVVRGTVSLLVPSGSYTLVVTGASEKDEDGNIGSDHTGDSVGIFLPIKEHIDTSEEVRTVIDRMLTLKRHLIVNVTRAKCSQLCSGAQVVVKDKFTNDIKTGICNDDGTVRLMLGPVPKVHSNGIWPSKGFTNNVIITAKDIGGTLKSKTVSCQAPDIKSTEGSLIEIDVGGAPIYDDDFQ